MKELEYNLYEEGSTSDGVDSVVEAAEELDREEPISIRGFTPFSYLVAAGFQRVSYLASEYPERPIFWVTDKHARMIGRALVNSLASFQLRLSRFEKRGPELIAEEVERGIEVGDLTISHMTGDEVTVVEADGIAQLATRLRCHTLHVWAAEYDAGALDALCDRLEALDNATLCELDVCDVTKAEPEDRIHLPRVTARLARNARQRR